LTDPVLPLEVAAERQTPRPALARSSLATLAMDQSVPKIRPWVRGAAAGGCVMVR
jgi:hypothetical protein